MVLFLTIPYVLPATLRLAGALEKSTEVMQHMQKLVKVQEIQATMMELSKEMMKVIVQLVRSFGVTVKRTIT